MSDWQPARVRAAHGSELSPQLTALAEATVVYVRPASLPQSIIDEYRRSGCDATDFFEVQESPTHPGRKGKIALCEHELLTD
jgi:hypothetical protein